MFRKIIRIVLVVLIVLFLGFWLFTRSLKPTYNGNLQLKSLQENVTVFYDDYGIPHIYAQNELDARRAFGYVHAQDRLWQMELFRRLAAGRLSELFGKELVNTDKFFSGLGIEEAAIETIKKLDTTSQSYKLTMAYLDGVNQYIRNGTKPIEYYLLGLEQEEFTLKDIYNVYGYMAFSFAMAHKTDPVLTAIKETLGNEYLKEFNIPIDSTTALLKTEVNAIKEVKIASSVQQLYKKLPIPTFIGSNSWVLAPEKTKNGKVIFANDPHIAFSQPSVWYQSHIVTPNYELYGFNLALTPFPLLGHNREYAYGLTMFENDDIDFFVEENNPENENQYKTPTGFKDYKIRKKTIKVKDGEPVAYNIKVSRHGPVMNNIIEQIDNERPIAMSWIYTQLENKITKVAYGISHAKSLQDFKRAASLLHAPGLNIMYGDAKDNIAWFASGKLYKYKNVKNTKVYLNGSTNDDEKVFLDFTQNPQSINPSSHYVYSANNQPDSINGTFYPGYYLPKDRAKRIEQTLESKKDFTQVAMQKMIYDVKSSITPSVITNISNSIVKNGFSDTEKQALQELMKWDGSYQKKYTAPTIYNRFLYEFLANTFKDEMGSDVFNVFLNTPLQKKIIAPTMAKDSSVWFDNIQTKDIVETKQQIITKSFKSAIAFLEKQLGEDSKKWTWDKVLTVEHNHPMGEVAALRKYFNVGPFATIGGNEVINNQIFELDSTGYYNVKAGPSTRRVIDFADVENAKAILPTGQSGNVLSNHYKDQAQKYLDGEFVPMLLNKKVIQKSKNKLVLKPN